MPTYHFRTDAAHGQVDADAPGEALRKLVADGEWPEDDTSVISDGAWLTIFDADGIPVLRRGQMP